MSPFEPPQQLPGPRVPDAAAAVAVAIVFVNIGVWSGWVWGETKRETPWLYLGAKFCWRSGIASRLATARRMAPSGLAEGV